MRLELIPGAVPGTPVVLAVPAAGGRRSPRTARGRPRISARARELGALEPAHAGFEHGPGAVGYRGGPLEERRHQLPVGRAGHGGGDPAVGRPQEAGGPAAADLAAPVVAGDGGPLDHQGEGIHPHRPAQPSRTPGDVGGQMPAAADEGLRSTQRRPLGSSGQVHHPRPGPCPRPVGRSVESVSHPWFPLVVGPSMPEEGVPTIGSVPSSKWTPCGFPAPLLPSCWRPVGVYGLVIDSGPSALVVEGDDLPDPLPGRSMERLQTLAAVVVAVVSDPAVRRPDWADVVVGRDDALLGAVLATVADSPLASTTLAVLLRTGPHRSVRRRPGGRIGGLRAPPGWAGVRPLARRASGPGAAGAGRHPGPCLPTGPGALDHPRSPARAQRLRRRRCATTWWPPWRWRRPTRR